MHPALALKLHFTMGFSFFNKSTTAQNTISPQCQDTAFPQTEDRYTAQAYRLILLPFGET
jgi:hypothetical protein